MDGIITRWTGKKVLSIGDSITAPGVWQKEMDKELGCQTAVHAYGGIGLPAMVDGIPGWEGDTNLLPPLTADKVRGMDLILLFGGHNERETPYGKAEDMWPATDSIWGKYNYVLQRIYALLDEADNLTCRVAVIAPFCVGKYDWIDCDGYAEYPEGSGMSLEKLATLTCRIAASYNIPSYDAWHLSGINRFVRNKLAANPYSVRPDYDPSAVYGAPFPQNADQAHLNNQFGYPFLGRSIAGFVMSI